MSDKGWIDSLYTKSFPGVNLKALHAAFRKPDLLLRYVNMFQDEPEVVAVMQAWVGAVTEDVKNGLKGDKSALLKLRTGKTETSKKNKRHLDALVSAGANVEAWINAP